MSRVIPATLWLAFGLTATARADVDYVRDVKPILARRCVVCHGILKQKAGLRLDTAARLLQGGKNGRVVEPGESVDSELIDRVAESDPTLRMPPEGEGEALSAVDIKTLRDWIAAGAHAPANEPEPPDPRRHWAFQPPVRPQVPLSESVNNPIDAFLAAGYAANGVKPVAEAEKIVLIRRVYLDLTGIAPTPAEVAAFVADPADDAYEKVVDRLLSSPRYGERWGRHWMDVWRYSDWDGFGAEVRESQPHIWHWRDWIVENLNSDVGYDRMLVAMLAADEATPGDPSARRATGFLARNWYKFNRNAWLDNILEHTSKAFLGVTVNCARCHDHKYDPISQVDYYRLRALFEPHEVRADRVPGQPDTAKDGLACVYDARADEPTYLFVRGNEKEPAKDKPLTPAVPPALGGKPLDIKPVSLPLEAAHPGLRSFVREETVALARAEVTAREAEKAKGAPAPLTEKGLAAARAGLTAAEARVAADLARAPGEPAATRKPTCSPASPPRPNDKRRTSRPMPPSPVPTLRRRLRRTSNRHKKRSTPPVRIWRRLTPAIRRSAHRTRRPAPAGGWRSQTGLSRVTTR